MAFKKGYLPSWSDEIFIIVECVPTNPVMYELADFNGEKITRKFYEEKLQQIVKKNDVYKVEKVLKIRKRKGKKEYFV